MHGRDKAKWWLLKTGGSGSGEFSFNGYSGAALQDGKSSGDGW